MLMENILLFLVFSLVTQTLAYVNLKPHNQTANTGNLQLARFCENLEIGSEIYQLSISGGTGSYRFSLSSEFSEYVTIDTSTGKITLEKAFDRELLNLLDVRADIIDLGDGSTDSVDTSVVILDANDNSPVIKPIRYSDNIYEYPWTPTTLADISVTDADSSTAGAVQLSIEGTNLFYVESVFGGNTRVLCNSTQRLDYDTNPIVIATLQAKDGGQAPCNPDVVLSTNQSLLFQIKDGPDQPPIFTNTLANIEINENTPPDTEIGKVFARDQDYGLDWDIVYDIVTDGISEKVFRVSRDGRISTISVLDREMLSTDNSGIYRFKIKATEVVPSVDPFSWKQEEVGYPFSTNTSVTVIIIDEDDNVPVFYKLNDTSSLNEKYESSTFTAEINEGSSIGSVVNGLNMFVEDIDQERNAEFDIEIVENDVPFELSTSRVSGSSIVNVIIQDSNKLDYEKNNQKFFNFTIVTTQVGTSVELSKASVFIELIDVNDNSPLFDRTLFKFNVSENSPIGAWVGIIHATDLDSRVYGEITYDILLGKDFFEVNSDGNITVKSPLLDREVIPTYYVTFTATDGGNRTTIVPAEVTLLDVNDNPPELSRDVYYSTMTDGDGSTELVIQATDLDVGENAKVNFSIVESEYSELFRIDTMDENTAILKPAMPLDIENISGKCESGDKHLTLTIVAEDNGTPKLNSTASVEITVQDINEFYPVFNDSNPSIVEVKEKSKLGTEIAQITAYDLDACSPNNQIDFEIKGENSLNFIIVKSTDGNYGSLQVRNTALDRDDRGSYQVVVMATDLGNPRFSTDYNLTVNLVDINDKNPAFVTSSLSDVAIREDEKPGSRVTSIEAIDSDLLAELAYGIKSVECLDSKGITMFGCESWFNITSFTTKEGQQVGIVWVADELDREQTQQIILTCVVEDLNAEYGIKQIDTALLSITLEDVNDKKPVFEPFGIFEVNEESNNTRIGQVRATDADIGLNSEIIYSVAPEFENYIQINPSTGEFSTKDALDHESMGETYNFTVIATDKGIPPLSSNETVTVTIRDTNDQNPDIRNLPANRTVPEDANFGDVVYKVNATDDDVGRNAELSFTLQEINLPFDIDRSSGVVTVVSKLDYERVKAYEVTVLVSDNGSPRLSDSKVLFITIEDTNDNPPKFTESKLLQNFTIFEGPSGPTGVIISEAQDADSPELQTNYYYLSGGDGVENFEVDVRTREIYIIKEIDRELKESYTLVVQVSDVKDLVHSSHLTCDEIKEDNRFTCVTITVGDLNDQSPVFNKREFVSDIAAETQPDADVAIAQVYATDLDASENARLTYSITKAQRCCPECSEQADTFTIEKTSGNVYLIQAVTLEADCYFRIEVQVTDGIEDHYDDAVLKIGVIKDDQTVKLLSTIDPSDFTTDKRDKFEEELGELIGATVIIDKVLPYKSEINPTIQSQVTFHAKITGTNDIVETSDIDRVLDSGREEMDIFLMKYGIKGRTVTVIEPEDKTLQIAFMSTSAVLLLFCVVLLISVICMKQRINRNKRVERAMEQTFQDLDRMNKSGVSNNYIANKNPLYDIDQPTLDIENPYDSTDDLDDEIDDNAIDNNDSVMINDETTSNCESISADDFEIDFSSPQDVTNEEIKSAINEVIDNQHHSDKYAFQDTGF